MDFKPAEREDQVRVRLIDGKHITITKKRVVGMCHNTLHTGFLTQSLMEQHECVGKNCYFFQKNECASYWEHLKQKRAFKKKRRAAKNAAKVLEDNELAKMADIKNKLQGIMDDCGYTAEIIEVKSPMRKRYTVFYVSQQTGPDESEFPDFFRMVGEIYPVWQVTIKHIKDVDGHYVTINEYKKRVKQ